MNADFRRLPTLDHLKGFEAAARHLSFTRAAEELFLTQSAISRQVQTLEEQLGVRLFQRLPRQLRLTAEGERLYATVVDVFARLTLTADSLRSGGRQPITVSTSIGMAALWLVPRLASFQEAHPEVEVRVSANNRLADLEREGIDLALRYVAPAAAPAGARLLFGEAVFPVAQPALVAGYRGRKLRAEDLEQLVLLSFDDGNRYPWLDWNTWLKALGLEGARPKSVAHFNHYDQTIRAAAEGQGLALGRGPLVRRMLDAGQLVALDGEREAVTARAYYLVKTAGVARPEVSLFEQWLLAQAAATQAAEAQGWANAAGPLAVSA
jgi:LysR family glycine cleavage system transcriptional activator